jgi:hypothetical protein
MSYIKKNPIRCFWSVLTVVFLGMTFLLAYALVLARIAHDWIVFGLIAVCLGIAAQLTVKTLRAAIQGGAS